jgi:hypothetical protein
LSRPLPIRFPALLTLAATATLWGCGGEPSDPAPESAPPVALPELPELLTATADAVGDWVGPGGEPFEVTRRLPGDPTHLHRIIGTKTYALALRPDEALLIQWPCTSCHEGVTITADRDPDAHGNIHPIHPSRLGEVCSTCHVPSAVDHLRLATGEEVSLDHAYRLCAQCHFQQAESWAAGAHGKRLYGWTGRRVVMNCTDCHDPHTPALEPRIPFPGPTLPARPGGSP